MDSEAKKIAVQAFEMSQRAYEEGEYELSQTYMLNAITHHADLKYLETYPTILKKLPLSIRNTHVDQAINLYSIALFNNPPEDILKIIHLIDEIRKLTVYEDDDATSANDVSAEFDMEELNEQIKHYSWASIKATGKIEDLKTLSERMDFFNSIAQLDVGKNVFSEIQDQLQETKTFIEFIGIRKSVEQYLREASSEIRKKDYNQQYIVSRMQQVGTLLSQLWLFDIISIIGKTDYFKQMNDLQQEYSKMEKLFLEKESETICEKIRADITSELSAKSSTCKYTAIIDDLQKKYAEFSARTNQIPLNTKAIEMQHDLQKITERLNDLLKKRYALYQKKCAKTCRDAIQLFEDTTWVWEKDAVEILRKCPIHTINEALISPETATILQMTKQILEGKLSPIAKADFAVKCIESEKMRLEDF